MSPETTHNDSMVWKKAFANVACQMYALLKACPRRTLLACSTVNPRHPLPLDHIDLVDIEMNQTTNVVLYKIPITAKLIAFLQSVLFAVRETARIFYIRIWFRDQINMLYRKSASVVIKTWFFAAPLTDGADFYFGRLPGLFRENGIDYIIVGGNLGKESANRFSRRLFNSGKNAIPEIALIPLWGPVAVLFDQLLTSLKLTKLMRKNAKPLFSVIASRASLECLKPSTFNHALHYYISKRAIEKWEPKAYLTLYEGQPWEKLAWLGVKAANSGCITIGYQHTVVMPHSWGLLYPHRDSWEIPAPEVVLTLGPKTEEMMKPGHQELGTEFVTFGSFRRTNNDIRIKDQSASENVVLVVPEGLIEEATLLFERAIQAAIIIPDHTFIFRCHPVLPFERINPLLSKDITSIPNIEVSSSNSIEDDFLRSSILLYRGSSVVLYGLLMGLKPFYLNEPGRPYVDPLFQLDGWRESVDSVTHLVEMLKKFTHLEKENARKEWFQAKTFVDQYSIQVSENAVSGFMKTVKEMLYK